MNAKHVTFNMPVSLHHQLRVFVGTNKMSKFVCAAVQDKLAEERRRLRQAYMEAEKERNRKETLDEWKITEGEGWE